MDYRELLKKFIGSVGDADGCGTERFINYYHSDVKFTDEEHRELMRLEKECEEES